MTEPTPPPEERLPDQARARIRTELLRTAQDGGGSHRRWLAPGLAAAAVVLVAASAAWAVRGGSGPDERAPAGGTGTSAAPATPSSTAPSTTLPSSKLEASRSPGAPPAGPGAEVGTGSCRGELANVLPGATEAVRMPDAEGTTSFWVAGGSFALCDVRAGVTTVDHPLPLGGASGVAPYRVSSLFVPGNGGMRAVRVAGGLVPEGVRGFQVSYTFPDGHTETSTTTADGTGRTWWRMVYEYADGGGNEFRQPPIEARVSSSAGRERYRLAWAVDTCAQANHGC